ELSVNQAQAILGHWRRVNRRVNRRAYRRGYYGGYAAPYYYGRYGYYRDSAPCVGIGQGIDALQSRRLAGETSACSWLRVGYDGCGPFPADGEGSFSSCLVRHCKAGPPSAPGFLFCARGTPGTTAALHWRRRSSAGPSVPLCAEPTSRHDEANPNWPRPRLAPIGPGLFASPAL